MILTQWMMSLPTTPLISVVIPLYNEGSHVKGASIGSEEGIATDRMPF